MKKILFYSLIIFLLATNSARAQVTTYKLLAPLPCLSQGCNSQITSIDVNDYIQYIFKFAIALAVLLAIVMLIYGGFEYMMSEVPFIKTNAKSTMTNAVFGLVAALASYLILLTIDPRLVEIGTTITPIPVTDNSNTTSDFLNQVNQNLSQLNEQAKTIVNNDQTTINTNQQQIAALVQKQQTDSPQDYLTDNTQIAALEQQISNAQAEQANTAAQGVAGSSFPNILKSINASAGGTLTSADQTAINANLLNITSTYDSAISYMIENGNTQQEQVLENEESFYKNQVTAEENLKQSIADNVDGDVPSPLQADLKTYSNPATDPDYQAVKNDPVLLKQYQQLTAARIAEINAALK